MTRRATDAEREAVRNMLSDAHVAGMITEEEWKERVSRTARVMDTDELQSLYVDITGTSIPVLALSVTREWYSRAGRARQVCEDIVKDRFLYLLWYGMPVAVLFAIYSEDMGWLIACGIYVLLTWLAVGAWFGYVDRLARRVKDVLEEAGVK